jgi:hypothetical protein
MTSSENSKPEANRNAAITMDLRAVTLTTSLGVTEDISYMIESFNLNEALLLPVTYGECFVLDGINLIDRVGIRGFDYLSFAFSRLGQETLVTKTFRIYDIRNRKRVSNSAQSYQILFCSEELFLASEYFIVKTYERKKVSEIIENIATAYLKIPSDRLEIEDTYGQIKFVCPYMRPLEAVQKVTRHALTKSDHPSYVFYETLREGFKFRSIESLFKAPELAEYNFNQAKLDSNVIVPTQIVSYESKKHHDSLLATQAGKFASSLLTFDPVTLVVKEIFFDLQEWFDKHAGIEGKEANYFSKLANIKNRKGDLPNKTRDSHSRFVATALDQTKTGYVKEKQPGILPIPLEKTDLARNSFFQNFVDNRIKLLVPGNTDLQCGKIIKIRIRSPEIQGESQEDEGGYGRYIITTLTHMLNADGTFFTQLTVVKDDSMYTTTPSTTGFGDLF